MIVPMQPVAVVLPSHQRTFGLKRLARLGVVHLRDRPEIDPGRNGSRIDTALHILESLEGEAEPQAVDAGDWAPVEIAERIETLAKERDALAAQIAGSAAELERLEPLGEFDSTDLHVLQDRGISLRFYEGPARAMSDWPESFPWQIVGRNRARVIVATPSLPEDLPSRWSDFAQPADSPAQLRQNLEGARAKLAATEAELRSFLPLRERLRHEADRNERRASFRAALAAMKAAPPVAWVEGYCPETKWAALESLAREEGWAVVRRELEAEDEPPTLFEHGPLLRSIHPVYRLISSLPGYREADVSLWFFVFLTLFFAVLIGDAGYGLLLLGLAVLARFSFGIPGPVFQLLTTFGAATTVWGALTGNWFGFEALGRAPVLGQLVIPGLDAWKTSSQDNVMGLCFLIGAIHLSVAHAIVGFRQRRSVRILAQLGWILILWGTWFVVRYLVLEAPVSPLTMPLLLSGIVLVAGFSSPRKNPLLAIGLGLGQLPLKLMNGFADLISYIRLFAVGMATLAVAASFNEIAGDVAKSGGVVSWILAGLVLVFGHGINLLMAALSVIVHGVRLNLMEFSGHADLTWSGVAYEPLTWKEEG